MSGTSKQVNNDDIPFTIIDTRSRKDEGIKRNMIRLTESQLHKMIKNVINEMAKIDKWLPDDNVTYDEYSGTYGISGDMRERNLQKSLRNNVPFEKMCPLCHKEMKDGGKYRQLYTKTIDGGSSTAYYAHPGDGRKPLNVGNGCIKNLEKTHKDKYNR